RRTGVGRARLKDPKTPTMVRVRSYFGSGQRPAQGDSVLGGRNMSRSARCGQILLLEIDTEAAFGRRGAGGYAGSHAARNEQDANSGCSAHLKSPLGRAAS